VKLDIPTNPSARWEWIKYQIRSRGLSFAELSRRLGVELGTLTSVKRAPYPRMERALASAIGVSPAIIWPERWNADGTPHRQRPKRAESRISHQNRDSTNYCADSNAPSTDTHRQVVTGA
jgi:Ner family transcriptional regulator